MKLVDILARELKVWPEGLGDIVGQAADGTLHSENDVGPILRTDMAYTECDHWVTDVVTRAQWQAAVDALKDEKVAEWNGEGLPPVGIEVEIHNKNGRGVVEGAESFIGTTCKVLATFVNMNGYEMVSVEDSGGSCMCFRADMCGPVRTPEQIAAEKRDAASIELAGILSGHDQHIAVRDIEMAKYLYDAGYRKQVTP